MIEADKYEYEKIPSDFPHPLSLGAVPGTQPKVLVREYEGKFYPLGCTPPEVYERWRDFEEVASLLAFEAQRSKTDNITLMSDIEMLSQYFEIVNQKSWISEDEAKWIIRRVGQILSWPVPMSVSA
ncbi:hypothetical protein NX786_00705 [Telluria mixta]|uniref:Uncharacterized protein n=1 Tax=Telluria mixta TaxID=34071 RepID=A0ABT2BRX0_9BURK|nr:hypothetical protein [Telluria mixta]MCS0627867.1 hypothetical protein [Telluria mixta]WEM94015.1 hypothetical protein P0M04_21285 [Telluria mixta]